MEDFDTFAARLRATLAARKFEAHSGVTIWGGPELNHLMVRRFGPFKLVGGADAFFAVLDVTRPPQFPVDYVRSLFGRTAMLLPRRSALGRLAFGSNRIGFLVLVGATAAVPGMVRTQAQTTRPATPQRTALSRFSEPTPTIAPVMVCVVLTGTPPKMVSTRVHAAPVSAQKPSTGRSLMIRWPIVLTMRQPPHNVPRPIAT